MLSSTNVRQWLSPLVSILFAAIALTGILMWLEVRAAGVKQLHEIGGLVFVVAGVVHVASNWRALTAYFRKRTAWVTLGAGVLACLLFVVVGTMVGGEREGDGGGRERHERRDARQARP